MYMSKTTEEVRAQETSRIKEKRLKLVLTKIPATCNLSDPSTLTRIGDPDGGSAPATYAIGENLLL
jgi:hypothetical protein